MAIYIQGDQGTDAWKELRRGVVSASHFEEIVQTNGKPSESRTKYLWEVAGEIITGECTESKKFGSMQKGNDREQEARDYYQVTTGQIVDQYAFIYKDESKRIGCSPDGIIDPIGGFESKNAEPHVQIERLETGLSKALHFQQVQGSMWVTGRKWWDLQSYCRKLPNIVIRYEPDLRFFSILDEEIARFVFDVDKLVAKYS